MSSIIPLISKEQLGSAKKILFMTHLAIGDFVYQRVFLDAIKQCYPQLQLDIWIDDCRIRHKSWHAGRNDTLCQWLDSEVYLDNVYPIAKNSEQRNLLIEQAKQQNYDIVFFIALHRSERYAKFARKIAPKGIVVGSKSNSKGNPLARLIHFSKLNGYFELTNQMDPALHISQVFCQRFAHCLDLDFVTASNAAMLPIPKQFRDQASDELQKRRHSNNQKVMFVNHLSTNEKRNFQWHKLMQLLLQINKCKPGTLFVINSPPAELGEIRLTLSKEPLLQELNTFVFCAEEHFFQLPAMIQASDLVLTVETAVMHLASVLKKPQVVLMRASAMQWKPLVASQILYGQNRVDQITVEDVLEACLQTLDR